MSKIVIYDQRNGIERALVVKHRHVVDCYFNNLKNPQQTGALVMATLARKLPAQKGSFFDIGGARNAFLKDSVGCDAPALMQIKTEARGDKGPSLTHSPALPGLYFIHRPYGQGIEASRRSGAVHETTAKILKGRAGGWVMRSAAQNRDTNLLQHEADELEQAGKNLAAPLAAPSAFERALLDHAGDDFSHALVEAGLDLGPVTAYLRTVRPTLLAQLRISTATHAFQDYDGDAFYQSLLQKTVALPRGGDVRFDESETLCAVDVNAGDRTDDTAVNHEAAIVIMQHLRWRHIGGMVVIDFLKTKNRQEKDALLAQCKNLAAQDSTACEVYGHTRMGLFEIARARRGFSLREVLA